MRSARLQSIPRYLLSLAAGALTPLAFAPVNLPALAIAMPALLVVAWLGATPRSAFGHGYLFGLGLFGVGINWLHISINQFGGVGFTWEYEPHLYFKRARATESWLGDPAHHRERVARALGL